MNTVSYKPLVEIAPHLQLRCNWRQQWTD